jgi:hypothetical protein
MLVKDNIDLDWQIKSLIFDFAQKNNLIFESKHETRTPLDRVKYMGDIFNLIKEPTKIEPDVHKLYLDTLDDYAHALRPVTEKNNWNINVKNAALFAHINNSLDSHYKNQLNQVHGAIGSFSQCFQGLLQYASKEDSINFFQFAYDKVHSYPIRKLEDEKKLLLKVGKLFSDEENELLKKVYLNYLNTNSYVYLESLNHGERQFLLYEILTERFGEKGIEVFSPYIKERKYEEKHIAFADYNEQCMMIHLNKGYLYEQFKYPFDMNVDKLTYYNYFETALNTFFNHPSIKEKYGIMGFSSIYGEKIGDEKRDYNHYLLMQSGLNHTKDDIEQLILNIYRYLDMNPQILLGQSQQESTMIHNLDKLFLKQKLDQNRLSEEDDEIVHSVISSPKI